MYQQNNQLFLFPKDSLLREEGDGAGRRAESVVDRIYKVIREIASGDGRKSLKVSEIYNLTG